MYQRYPNPEKVLGRFSTWEVAFYLAHIFEVDIYEEREEFMFDTWLHKVWDKTYSDWRKEVTKSTKKSNQRLSDEEAERNLKKANSILGVKEV